MDLHPHQVPHYGRLLSGFMDDGRPDLCLWAATGYGKTVMTRVVASALVRMGALDKVVFTSPMTVIKRGFQSDLPPVRISGHGVVDPLPVGSSSRDDLVRCLVSPSVRMSAVCHGIIGHEDWLMGVVPHLHDLRRCLLVVDEAHRAWGTQLGKAVCDWRSKGGRVMLLSATPGDLESPDSPIGKNRVEVLWTLADQMDAGFAPGTLESSIVDVGGSWTDDADSMMSPDDPRKTARAMADKWDGLGRPPLIIQCCNLQDNGRNREARDALLEEFVRLGVQDCRLRPITNVSDNEFSRFQKDLEADRSGDAQFDVVIGMNRAGEGLDWPRCSAGFRWGIPSSISSMEQFIGRFMRHRAKIPGHPADWVNRSHFSIFASGLSDMDAAHSRQVFLTSAFLASYDVARRWSVLGKLRRMVQTGSFGHRGSVMELPSDYEVGVAAAFLERVCASASRFDKLTASDARIRILGLASRAGHGLSIGAVNAAILGRLHRLHPDSVDASIEAELTNSHDIRRALDKVVDQFRAECVQNGLLVQGAGPEILKSQTHILGANVMRSTVESMELVPEPVSSVADSICYEWARSRNNKWPRAGSLSEDVVADICSRKLHGLPEHWLDSKTDKTPQRHYFPHAYRIAPTCAKEIREVLGGCIAASNYLASELPKDLDVAKLRSAFGYVGPGLSPLVAAVRVANEYNASVGRQPKHQFNKDSWRQANVAFLRSVWPVGHIPGPYVELLGISGHQSYETLVKSGLIGGPDEFVGVDLSIDAVSHAVEGRQPFTSVRNDILTTALLMDRNGRTPCCINYDAESSVGDDLWWQRFGDSLSGLVERGSEVHGSFALILNFVLDVPMKNEAWRLGAALRQSQHIQKISPDWDPECDLSRLIRSDLISRSGSVHVYRSRKLRMITFRVTKRCERSYDAENSGVSRKPSGRSLKTEEMISVI